uniref:Putative aminotransferase n=1 Tax=Streptosporangium amethystogenes TaxID=2002 RepID=M4ZR18_9ACTN|nr:putative aminotransferase [Streptosporangium amethystogenes]
MTTCPEEVMAETRDTECVVAYRRVRHGVFTSHQIGYGRNMYPASPDLVAQIRALVSVLFEQRRMTDYSTEFDGSDRHLIGGLVAEWLGCPEIGPGDVFVMSGATEAISVVTRYLAERGYGYVLPLPCYYAFEQSARRWRMPVDAHYNGDGLLHETRSGSPRALVDIVPNGVTGRRFRLPAGVGDDFRIVDSVFQVSATATPGSGVDDRHLREVVRDIDLGRGCVMLTASKDLSIPGLRAGLLVTRDPGLRRYLEADRFERCFSLNPLSTSVIALYAALMCARASRRQGALAPGRSLVPPRVPLSRPAAEDPLTRMLWESPVIDDLDRYLLGMARHYDSVLEIYGNRLTPLGIDLAPRRPETGYSLFLPLPVQVDGPESAVVWCNRVGRELGLKLNPAAIFGGSDEPWTALYDCTRPWVRFNCSVAETDAVGTMDILDSALR